MHKPKLIKLIFYIAFSFLLLIAINEFLKLIVNKNNLIDNHILKNEHFDPSLNRIMSISEFVTYCDSLYGDIQLNASDSEKYAIIVSKTLRERFYHGYSHYSLGNNTFGYILSSVYKKRFKCHCYPK